ncbi:MAG: YceI family protein [Saprospiraceae bacterium]|nr:YceI family protein [Saprospiraceae bacterium]
MRKTMAFVLSFCALLGTGNGQEQIQISEGPNETVLSDPIEYVSLLSSSSIKISGTSTLHDWESNVEDFIIKATRNGEKISAQATVQVGSIKSGKYIMDKNTYKALKESEFPTISLLANNLNIKDNQAISGSGQLTVAGQTRTIPMSLSMTSWAEESITVCCDIPIKMTDFGIAPPVALLGTVKTGDEIVLKFDITLIED